MYERTDSYDCLYAAYEDAERRAWTAAATAVADDPSGDVAAEPDTARLFTAEARIGNVAFPRLHLMSRRLRAPASAISVLLVLAVAGCGGGDDEPSSAAQRPATGRSSPAGPSEPPSSEGNASSGEQGEPREEPARGGEASIEDFGEEAEASDREAILGSFEAYLGAIASRDYESACARLSTSVQRSLERFAPKALKANGCTSILPKLLSPTAPAIAREQAEGKVSKVRVEGELAFVVFKAPGAKLYQLTMVQESGEWKATTVSASVLVPDL